METLYIFTHIVEFIEISIKIILSIQVEATHVEAN